MIREEIEKKKLRELAGKIIITIALIGGITSMILMFINMKKLNNEAEFLEMKNKLGTQERIVLDSLMTSGLSQQDVKRIFNTLETCKKSLENSMRILNDVYTTLEKYPGQKEIFHHDTQLHIPVGEHVILMTEQSLYDNMIYALEDLDKSEVYLNKINEIFVPKDLREQISQEKIALVGYIEALK